MTATKKLQDDIEAFLAQHGMAPTVFGRAACNNPHAVRRLRAGLGLTMRSAEQMRQFMATYKPTKPVSKPRPRKRRPTESAAAA